MQAIILCGGLSTRLGDITKDVPKVLLDIGERTVLDIQFELLSEAGVNEVILASGHLHDVLYTTIGQNYAGMQVHYAKEEKRLGTGGAIKNAMREVLSSPFFVLNGDILVKDFPLSQMLNRFEPEMDALLLTVFVEDMSPYGEIRSDEHGKVTAFLEKQSTPRAGYANGAMYLFNQSIAHYFPVQDEFSVEQDVFPRVQNLHAFKAKIDWIDIGVPERLAYARRRFG